MSFQKNEGGLAGPKQKTEQDRLFFIHFFIDAKTRGAAAARSSLSGARLYRRFTTSTSLILTKAIRWLKEI